MTRSLKKIGDILDNALSLILQSVASAADTEAAINALRCIMLFIFLTERFVGRFLPQVRLACSTCNKRNALTQRTHQQRNMQVQMMALLSSAVRPTIPSPVKLAGLEAWLMLINALEKHAASQLSSVLNQVMRSSMLRGSRHSTLINCFFL